MYEKRELYVIKCEGGVMSDITHEMTAPYRSCDRHKDESWLEDCLHCRIESLEAKLKQAREGVYESDAYIAQTNKVNQYMEMCEEANKTIERVRGLNRYEFLTGQAYKCSHYVRADELDKALEQPKEDLS